jgi:Fe2+ or Zn2+ uptake regulation protein
MDIPTHVVGEVMSQLKEMNPAQIYFALKVLMDAGYVLRCE